MQHFPQEFLEAPPPLVALVGVPELHAKVAEYLQSLQPPVLSLFIHDPAKVTALGGRERRPPDAKLPPPVGIIKADWLTKHRERSASIVVVSLERERVYGDPAQWMGVCAELNNINPLALLLRTCAQVLSPSLPASVERYEREIPDLACLFAPAGGAALEAAATFYREEGRRVKARVERHAYSHSELSVRYYFKVRTGARVRYTFRKSALARLEAFDTGWWARQGRPHAVPGAAPPLDYPGDLCPRPEGHGPAGLKRTHVSMHFQSSSTFLRSPGDAGVGMAAIGARPTKAEYIRHALLASRHVSPSHAVIELLAKAHEQLGAGGGGGDAARIVYQLGGKMGREYFPTREYDNARRLVHSVAGCYRQKYIEYSLELAALPSGATAEGEGSGLVLGPEVGPAGPLGRCQQGTGFAELVRLLRGTTAVLPPRDEELGLAVSEAYLLDLEIDMCSPLRPVLVATAVFLERAGKLHERQTLLLGLRTHLPDALSLWDLQVELSNPACRCTVAPAGLPGGAAAAGPGLGVAAGKEGQSGAQPPVVLLPGVWNRFELQVLPSWVRTPPCGRRSRRRQLSIGSLWGAKPALAEPPFLDPALCLAGHRVLEVEEEDALADVCVECAPVGLAEEILPVRVVVKSRGHAISAGELAIQLAPLGPPVTASVTSGLVPPGRPPAVPGGSAMDGDGEAATQPCSAEVLLSRPLAGALGYEWSSAPGVAAAGRHVRGEADGGESSSGPTEGREEGEGRQAESEGNEEEGGGKRGGGGGGGGEGGDRGHEALHVESTRSIDVDGDNFVPLTGVLEVPPVAANGSWETLVHLRFCEAAGVSLRASLTYAHGGQGRRRGPGEWHPAARRADRWRALAA
eukprot:jgi/Mesen1/2201/ME000152S01293